MVSTSFCDLIFHIKRNFLQNATYKNSICNRSLLQVKRNKLLDTSKQNNEWIEKYNILTSSTSIYYFNKYNNIAEQLWHN